MLEIIGSGGIVWALSYLCGGSKLERVRRQGEIMHMKKNNRVVDLKNIGESIITGVCATTIEILRSQE